MTVQCISTVQQASGHRATTPDVGAGTCLCGHNSVNRGKGITFMGQVLNSNLAGSLPRHKCLSVSSMVGGLQGL